MLLAMKRIVSIHTLSGVLLRHTAFTLLLLAGLISACSGESKSIDSPETTVAQPSSVSAMPSPSPSSSPTSAASAPALPFFGVNGHYIHGGIYASIPLATQAASLADLGMRVYRQDVYTPEQIDQLANTVIPGLGPNVTVLPMIEAYPWNDPSLNGRTPTEASAYAYAYGMSVYAAKQLAGIPMVEFGNEYDSDRHNAPVANDGVDITDYDNATFPIWRGALRGALAGWRSVDTGHVTKLIANAGTGWLHFGFLDGLMTGTQPDGTTGHPKLTPDAIQWHWYANGGDFEHALGKTGTYNVLARLKATYGLPIVFTEIGVNPDNTSAQMAAYMAKTVPELIAARAAYNVIGFDWYELYDDPSGAYGLLDSNGVAKPRYAVLKSAIAAASAGAR